MFSISKCTAIAAVLLIPLMGCGTSNRTHQFSRMSDESPKQTRHIDSKPENYQLRPVLSNERGKLVLADLLKSALGRNPMLRAARESSAAAKHSRPQVTALPDPTLKLGWYAESIETRTGSQEFSIGLSQGIPWPEKLALAGDVADLQSAQAQVQEWIVGRDIVVKLTQRYHELSYLIQAELASSELEELWADLVARAAGTASISSAELARAETRLAQTRYDRLVLKELALVQKEKIRALLAADETTEIGTPEILELPSLDCELDALKKALLVHSQEVLLAHLRIEEARAKEDMAEASRMPDFSIGGRYVVTDPRTDASPSGNGDDPLMFELGISIPLQQGAKSAKIAAARHRAIQAAFSRDSILHNLRSDLAEAFFKARNWHRLVELYEKTLVPQAERAAQEAETTLKTGNGGLAGLIETIAARHQVRIGALRARTDYAIGLSRIEQLLGTPLDRISSAIEEKTP